MAQLETFPVTKNGKFIGYADARQIAASKGKLKLFDESKAKAAEAEAKVEAAEVAGAEKKAAVESASKSGGADPASVKKAPAAK